jgi:putative flippase GtrA
MDTAPRTPLGPITSFVRFVLSGGGTTLLGSAALVFLAARMDLVVANLLVAIATTLLANELHARFSFASDRRGLSMHLQSALTAGLCYLFTTGAMLALRNLDPGAGAMVQQGIYLAASGVAGFCRFLALRLIVFASRTPAEAAETADARSTVVLAA